MLADRAPSNSTVKKIDALFRVLSEKLVKHGLGGIFIHLPSSFWPEPYPFPPNLATTK